MAHRILLLEDEQAIADTLHSEGFQVQHVRLVQRDGLGLRARRCRF